MSNLVSVIIPIYNVEQYLEKCLDSIINQTYKNLEIICVNDCSPDNSSKILDEYSSRDKRIKIVNREKNGGLSAARNTGLDNATGEYIYFLDSDDWIDENYIECMLNAALSSKTEVVLNTNIISEYENFSKKYTVRNFNPDGEFINKINAINKAPAMAWCRLFERNFLLKNNLKFLEGFIHEDIDFHHRTLNLLDKIYIFEGAQYHYLQRKNGIMQKRKSKVISCLQILEPILNYYNDLSKVKKYIHQISVFNFNQFVEISSDEDLIKSKEVLSKLDKYYDSVGYNYSDFENYAHSAVVDSKNYSEFKQKYGNLYTSFLRNNIKKRVLK